MNMMIVDVSSLPNVKPGEVAVLIGKSGMHSIPALWSGYDTRNITTSIAPSIPRILV
jgi:alanine racemase